MEKNNYMGIYTRNGMTNHHGEIRESDTQEDQLLGVSSLHAIGRFFAYRDRLSTQR